MSEKGKEQALKFDINVGGKKQTYEVVNAEKQAHSFYNWFSTLKGQKVVGSIWIGLSAFGALYHLAPHWFFLNQIKSIYQSYNKGFKTQVQNEMLDLLNTVVTDMNLSDQETQSLNVFISSLSEPNGWGELGKNCLLGYPDYFHYNSTEDVPMNQMRIGTHATGAGNSNLTGGQIESPLGKSFAESLVLTDNAKKFAFAREIERTRTQPFMTHGVFSFCYILLTYNLARILNKRLELLKRPPLFRGLMYMGLWPFMVFGYFMTKDAYNRHMEKALDKSAAGISPDYSQGGVEYYNKILQRNVSIREFQGESGRSLYTGKGDVIQGIIRVKSPNITDRRDICGQQNFVKAS